MLRIPLLCLLFSWFGALSAQEIRNVNVPEGDDAPLHCTLTPGYSIDEFDWRKDNGEEEKKEVFMYKRGYYYGNGLQGQNEQFKDRIVFFPHELKLGNASIIIKNTRLEDSGIYTCGLLKQPRQEVHIRLNVDGVLLIRSDHPGAARKPYINIIDEENTWRLLVCIAQGDPEPEVEWRNSKGEVLVKHVPEAAQNGRSQVELTLNVSKSDKYTCVVTQEKYHHRINNTMRAKILGEKNKAGSEHKNTVVAISFLLWVGRISVVV